MLPETNANPLDLVALVGSRLCHDLISPLGAIGNGVELLMMTSTGPISPELQLISESVAAANARVKFFRLAFGNAGEQRLGRAEMINLMREMSHGSRVQIGWRSEPDFPRQIAKIACLAVLCIEPAMPRGGEIVVEQDTISNAGGWTVRGVTTQTKEDFALWGNLDERPTGSRVTPAQVQFALLPRETLVAGRRLRWSFSATEVVIAF